jgi:hypothetical protein
MPWLLALPLMAFGLWASHTLGRLLHPALVHEASSREAAETHAHLGAASVGAAEVLAPFAAILVVVLVARLFAAARGRRWQGVAPAWFLVLPAGAYVFGELAERALAGEALAQHASQEMPVLPEVLLQVGLGVLAYAVAHLLVAAIRVVRRFVKRLPSLQLDKTPRAAVVSADVPPVLWTCIVGAHGLRGPPLISAVS